MTLSTRVEVAAMSWARIDDGFYENAKQLRMSDAAFRVYVCALSRCSKERDPSGYLSQEQARSLVGSLGKSMRVVTELVKLNAWEAVTGGYLIHDFELYVDRGSVERMRKLRERKRHETDPSDVTVTSPVTPSDVTRARASAGGNPIPEPVPIPELLPTLSDSPPPSPPRRGAEGSAIVPLENKPPALTAIDGSLLEIPYRRFVAELNTATKRHFQGDAESQKLFQRRLQEGRSIDDLMAAARGVALSKHHMGLNDSGIPYNAPANVLRSKVLDQLISLGRGEIGFVREETADERNKREIHEWAVAKEAEQAAERERKARGGGA